VARFNFFLVGSYFGQQVFHRLFHLYCVAIYLLTAVSNPTTSVTSYHVYECIDGVSISEWIY
jgi:hypothetical protein